MNYVHFSRWLKNINHYTVTGLAARVGVSRIVCSHWINGHSLPSSSNLLKICLAVETSKSTWQTSLLAAYQEILNDLHLDDLKAAIKE